GLNDDPLSEALRNDSTLAVDIPEDQKKTGMADANEDQTSALPPEIEELRQKLSNKSAVKPKATSLAASVNALSSSERYGVPTFSTFKFGYVPARGLLYSSIGHELALLGLFLIFTYGMPAFKG